MESKKSLLVVKTQQSLSLEQMAKMKEMIGPLAERCGCEVLIADENFDASIHSDIRPLLEAQLEAQRNTYELLLTLIEALGEDQGVDEDSIPAFHLDGTPA